MIYYLDDYQLSLLDTVYERKISKLKGKWIYEDEFGRKLYGATNRKLLEKHAEKLVKTF